MKLLPTLILVVATINCSAQTTADSSGVSKHFTYSKNRFKVGLSDIARGNLAFYYEHLLNKYASVEIGAGLTFDDLYAINQWEGKQYIERDNFTNTRGSFSLGFNLVPFERAPFLYFGVNTKFRQYYSADIDFFHSSSGMFLGANRSESLTKFKIGNLFQDHKGFVFDFSVGIGYLHSKDEWAYFDYINSQKTYHHEHGVVEKWMISVDVKMGFGGKKRHY